MIIIMNNIKLSLFKEKKLLPLSVDIIGIIQKYNLISKDNVIVYKNDYLRDLKIRTNRLRSILDNFNTNEYRIESLSYYSSLNYVKRYIWMLKTNFQKLIFK
jgi:hypothetical protein